MDNQVRAGLRLLLQPEFGNGDFGGEVEFYFDLTPRQKKCVLAAFDALGFTQAARFCRKEDVKTECEC